MDPPSESAEMPPAVVDRARRYRARLGVTGVEFGPAESQPIVDETDTVLAVGALDGDQRSLEEQLGSIRESLRPGGELWFVEATRPIGSGSMAARAWSRLRTPTSDREAIERDTVAALRNAGWTICSIERFNTIAPDGTSMWWVDVVATDLGAHRESELATDPGAP